MKKKRPILKWWLDLGIFGKTLLMQSFMVILPVTVCVFILLNFTYIDYTSHVAGTSYNHARSALDSVEAELLQIKSSGNVLSNQKQIISVLTQDAFAQDSEEVGRAYYWVSSTAGIRHRVVSTEIFSTGASCEAAKAIFTQWQGTALGWQAHSPNGARASSLSWAQGVYDNEKLVGVVEINLQPDFLSEIVEKLAKISGYGCIAYWNESGEALARSDRMTEVTEDMYDSYKQLPEGYQLLNSRSYISIYHCTSVPLGFIVFGDVSLNISVVNEFFLNFCITIGVVILMGGLTIALNHFSITKRIKRLSAQIDEQSCKLQKPGAFGDIPDVRIEGNDEIGQLADNYSMMLEQLIASAQRERQAELLQQTARFSALQAQIQPHFLYNTLESLRMMADENDDTEVSEMLFVLGKLMRGSISGREQEICLTREIENCMCYLKLSKLRFEHLEYDVECRVNTDEINCPRFILQPLVENSIHHGISRSRTDGRVRLSVYREGALILIDVEDNGAGIPAERLEEIRLAMSTDSGLKQEQGGIGLCNVHHRLQIYYGGESGLEVFSTEGKGTLCRIRIDLRALKALRSDKNEAAEDDGGGNGNGSI